LIGRGLLFFLHAHGKTLPNLPIPNPVAYYDSFTLIVNWYNTRPPSTRKYFELSFLLPPSTFIIQRDAYDLSLEKQLSKNLQNKQTFKAIKL